MGLDATAELTLGLFDTDDLALFDMGPGPVDHDPGIPSPVPDSPTEPAAPEPRVEPTDTVAGKTERKKRKPRKRAQPAETPVSEPVSAAAETAPAARDSVASDDPLNEFCAKEAVAVSAIADDAASADTISAEAEEAPTSASIDAEVSAAAEPATFELEDAKSGDEITDATDEVAAVDALEAEASLDEVPLTADTDEAPTDSADDQTIALGDTADDVTDNMLDRTESPHNEDTEPSTSDETLSQETDFGANLDDAPPETIATAMPNPASADDVIDSTDQAPSDATSQETGSEVAPDHVDAEPVAAEIPAEVGEDGVPGADGSTDDAEPGDSDKATLRALASESTTADAETDEAQAEADGNDLVGTTDQSSEDAGSGVGDVGAQATDLGDTTPGIALDETRKPVDEDIPVDPGHHSDEDAESRAVGEMTAQEPTLDRSAEDGVGAGSADDAESGAGESISQGFDPDNTPLVAVAGGALTDADGDDIAYAAGEAQRVPDEDLESPILGEMSSQETSLDKFSEESTDTAVDDSSDDADDVVGHSTEDAEPSIGEPVAPQATGDGDAVLGSEVGNAEADSAPAADPLSTDTEIKDPAEVAETPVLERISLRAFAEPPAGRARWKKRTAADLAAIGLVTEVTGSATREPTATSAAPTDAAATEAEAHDAAAIGAAAIKAAATKVATAKAAATKAAATKAAATKAAAAKAAATKAAATAGPATTAAATDGTATTAAATDGTATTAAATDGTATTAAATDGMAPDAAVSGAEATDAATIGAEATKGAAADGTATKAAATDDTATTAATTDGTAPDAAVSRAEATEDAAIGAAATKAAAKAEAPAAVRISAAPLPAHRDDWEQRVLDDPNLLDDIGFAVGGPFHVMYPQRVARNIRGFREVFVDAGVDGAIYYGKKANKSACVARVCAENGTGVDVSSVGELTSALAQGVRGAELMVTGPAKSDDLLWLAVRHGALIALDALDELARLERIASADAAARVLLRVLPAGSDSRFGLSEREIGAAMSAIGSAGTVGLKPIQLEGFSFHLTGYDATARTTQAAALIEHCLAARAFGHPAGTLSIGGGFGVDYLPEAPWQEFTAGVNPDWFHAGKRFESFYPYHFPAPGPAMLSAILEHDGLGERLRDNDIRLAIEPGRALLDGAGSTVFRVRGGKIRHAHGEPYQLLTVDGTSLSLSEQWFDSEFLPDPVLWPRRAGAPTPASVGAATCLESDMLSWRRIPLPRPAAVGDLLVYPNTAGYQMDSNESAFHDLPIPPKVVVHEAPGDRFRWTLDS
ncbi:hypothetical protein AB0H76_00500 [Nocardia sp. NPDC050712]|uniref:hypothetical protein n=1 Tax=Nocardia sp. NPDC050712 TaxID=3155518 RepID=UPI003401EFD2